ncbi:MAG: amino acid ABC transporter permease [Propionibacteriaceae bacterium]|jgi:polar amino acid transport system permease protein|nr:amino acid ABC transporter permease [Propionibacteriaceae bacterium]
MNWDLLATYTPMYADALWVVVQLGFWGVFGSLILGALVALVRHWKVPVVDRIAGGYIEVARNTPSMVQLYFLYFGLPLIGVKASGFACAIAGLTFLGGAYMAEAIRSGLEAVREGQYRAAASLGLSQTQTMRLVVLPQALAVALPAITANVIFLIKETSIVSIIAVVDLMALTQNLIGMFYTSNEAYLMLVISYLVLLLPVSIGLRALERRFRRGIA